MRKKILINSLFLFVAFSLSACATRTAIPTAPVTHYIPIKYDITCAKGINAPENLVPIIKKKIQEYLDDKNYWNKNSKPVELSIKITHIEEGSKIGYIMIGPLAPASILAAEVVLTSNDKPIESYRINSKNRENSVVAGFVDLTDRMARQFVIEVMETIQRPYED